MDSGITPLSPAEVQKDIESAKHEGYLHRVIEEVDVLANVVAGGEQDETISSRSARDAQEGHELGKIISHGLDLVQADHGAKAELADEVRGEEVANTEQEAGTPPVTP